MSGSTSKRKNMTNQIDLDKNQNNTSSALIDVIWVLTTLFVIKYWLLQYPEWWTFAGPIALLSAFTVASWRMKRNNQTWTTFGWFKQHGKWRLIWWTCFALITTILAGSLLNNLLTSLIEPTNQLSADVSNFYQNRFANLPGNWSVYIYWILLSWVIGGFVEEMLFRGFLLKKSEQILAKIPAATVWAICFQAILFGQQHHYYQGMIGFAETTLIALISGLLFILFKRTLWPLILSHGLANTLGLTQLFLSQA